MDQTKQLVDKAYGGNMQGLVNMLVQGDLVTDADTDELRKFWEGE